VVVVVKLWEGGGGHGMKAFFLAGCGGTTTPPDFLHGSRTSKYLSEISGSTLGTRTSLCECCSTVVLHAWMYLMCTLVGIEISREHFAAPFEPTLTLTSPTDTRSLDLPLTTCSCLGINITCSHVCDRSVTQSFHARLAAYASRDLHEACQAMLPLPMTSQPT